MNVSKLAEQKVNLLGFSYDKLISFFADIAEKKFRASQLMKWIYQKGELDFTKMNNFPLILRKKLAHIAIITPPQISKEFVTSGTSKYLIKTKTGALVEMVLIPANNRQTLCISSQAGCVVNCSFCATGAAGFQTNLSRDEIIGQVWLAVHKIKSLKKITNHGVVKNRITNVVFMGMGEPLLNFNSVMDASSIMLDKTNGFGLSRRRVTISTVGIVPAIKKMIGKTTVSLTISLHAGINELRSRIVPLNNKYNLQSILAVAKEYLQSLHIKSHITFSYTLLKGVNDSEKDAWSLVALLQGFPCKINLIPFNSYLGTSFTRPLDKTINTFSEILHLNKFRVTIRSTMGSEINAACGQLVGKINPKNKTGVKRIYAKNI